MVRQNGHSERTDGNLGIWVIGYKRKTTIWNTEGRKITHSYSRRYLACKRRFTLLSLLDERQIPVLLLYINLDIYIDHVDVLRFFASFTALQCRDGSISLRSMELSNWFHPNLK